MKQYHLMEDSPQILFRRHRSLALDVAAEQGEFRFFCEFLAPSFSRFSKARAFHHPDPAFSRLFLIEKGTQWKRKFAKVYAKSGNVCKKTRRFCRYVSR